MTPVAAPVVAGPVFAPAQVFHLPKPPGGDSAAARRLAGAMRQAADEVEAAQRQAHRVLADAHRCWTGASSTAAQHPLAALDAQTRHVSTALREAADRLERYAAVLDHAHRQHHWSWGKVLTVAAVVVVTATVVVVTVGAAAPAAAAVDGALVGAEVAATASAVTAAAAAAAEAAEAVTVAVRALQALRAVAAFLRPQVYVTAGLTDLEGFRQVGHTGHLDVPVLLGHAATDVSYGAAGGRLAGIVGGLGAHAANPVARWVLPKLATSTAWSGAAAAEDYTVTGHVDAGRVATAGGFALGGAAAEDLLPHVARYLGPFNGVEHEVHGQFPPKRLPREQLDALLSWLATHNGSPPPGWPGGRVFRNDDGNLLNRLPEGAYREYDIGAPHPARGRGTARLLIDSRSGAIFFTDVHYKGFRRFR